MFNKFSHFIWTKKEEEKRWNENSKAVKKHSKKEIQCQKKHNEQKGSWMKKLGCWTVCILST